MPFFNLIVFFLGGGHDLKKKFCLCFWNVIGMHLGTVSVVPAEVMIFVADRHVYYINDIRWHFSKFFFFNYPRVHQQLPLRILSLLFGGIHMIVHALDTALL